MMRSHCTNSGLNHMFTLHFKSVGDFGKFTAEVQTNRNMRLQRGENQSFCSRLLLERQYLCVSVAHLVLVPGDGVHGNRPPL